MVLQEFAAFLSIWGSLVHTSLTRSQSAGCAHLSTGCSQRTTESCKRDACELLFYIMVVKLRKLLLHPPERHLSVQTHRESQPGNTESLHELQSEGL